MKTGGSQLWWRARDRSSIFHNTKHTHTCTHADESKYHRTFLFFSGAGPWKGSVRSTPNVLRLIVSSTNVFFTIATFNWSGSVRGKWFLFISRRWASSSLSSPSGERETGREGGRYGGKQHSHHSPARQGTSPLKFGPRPSNTDNPAWLSHSVVAIDTAQRRKLLKLEKGDNLLRMDSPEWSARFVSLPLFRGPRVFKKLAVWLTVSNCFI